jgi:hypothetical protein
VPAPYGNGVGRMSPRGRAPTIFDGAPSEKESNTMTYIVVCKLVEDKLDVPDPIITEFHFKMADKLENHITACSMAISAMMVLGYREEQFDYSLYKLQQE